MIEEKDSNIQTGQRLQKVLAAAGVGSRRYCESLIAAGRVSIDGTIVDRQGTRVLPGARVEVDGNPVGPRPEAAYYVLNKPAGYVTTMKDTHGRSAIPDLLRAAGIGERVFPVGRLDRDTEGLLLLTNDGSFADAIIHPRHGVEKTYLAWVEGAPTPRELALLRRGVLLAEGRTAPARVELLDAQSAGGTALVRLVIHEGHKRQVRRMFASVGHPVVRLVRVAIGGLRLEGLAPGEIRPLSALELAALRRAGGLAGAGAEKP